MVWDGMVGEGLSCPPSLSHASPSLGPAFAHHSLLVVVGETSMLPLCLFSLAPVCQSHGVRHDMVKVM